MKGNTVMIFALIFILLGGLIFCCTMTAVHWDFKAITTTQYVTNTHEITEEYRDIAVEFDTADVVFVAAEGDGTTVTCYEETKGIHQVSVKDGTLTVQLQNKKRWYEYIGISFGTPKITVALPAGQYGGLTMAGSTGDVTVPEAFSFETVQATGTTGKLQLDAAVSGAVTVAQSTGGVAIGSPSVGSLTLTLSTGDVKLDGVRAAGDVAVKVSTGKVKLTDVTCKNLQAKTSTGDVVLTDVVASEAFRLQCDTGDVRLENADAAELYVETDTGDVRGTLRTEKVFFVETDTGRVEVPKSVQGGRCEVTTDTGDVTLEIK